MNNTELRITYLSPDLMWEETAAALSELLNMGVGDLAAKLGFAEGSPETLALKEATEQCSAGEQEACKTATELNDIDKQRDELKCLHLPGLMRRVLQV